LLTSLGLVALGLALLVVGGEALLRGSVALATLLRLTPAVIGLTVVAAGTSVPELAVSIIAAYRGSADITVGNVVGSNIFNITLIVGLAALVRPLAIVGNTIRLEYPVLALVTLTGIATMQDGLVNRLDATLYIAIYIGFTAYLVNLVRQQLSAGEASALAAEVEEIGDRPAAGGPSLGRSLALVAIGIALLGGGAHSTVAGAVELARMLGWSERVIGLTIVAAGTSLPEIVASMVSAARGRVDVAIGNVIGSNLFNILGILGLSSLALPLEVDAAIVASDNWWMLGTTLLLFPLMRSGFKITRLEGAFLVVVYVAYVYLLLRR
jgi:cation:H+ antiporter